MVNNGCFYELYNGTLLGTAWFSWYSFPNLNSVLVAGEVCPVVERELARIFTRVFKYNGKVTDESKFGAIIVFGGFGNMMDNNKFLLMVKTCLATDGVLLWVADNKLGTRFLCGDTHLGNQERYFSYVQWQQFFLKNKLDITNTYYILPGWHMARNIFTDKCLPSKENLHRIDFRYVEADKLIHDEAELLENIVDNDVFPQFANSFLFEYRQQISDVSVIYGDLSPDKGREEATALLCYSDGNVMKRPLYKGGETRHIYNHGEELRQRGLKVIPQDYIDESIIMPYVDKPLAVKVLAQAATDSLELFKAMLEKLWNHILSASDRGGECVLVFPFSQEKIGPILKKAYLDMIPTNAFWVDNDYMFFDQEYCYKDYPAKFVMYRALAILYGIERQIDRHVSLSEVKGWFGLNELWEYFQVVEEKEFQWQARNWDVYRDYHKKHTLNLHDVYRNKYMLSRLDMLTEDYMFAGGEKRQIVLFGAGVYCDRYMEQYGDSHPPVLIVDNDKKKWHTLKHGVEICNPQILLERGGDGWLVIICSTYIKAISEQLENMGIKDYRVY